MDEDRIKKLNDFLNTLQDNNKARILMSDRVDISCLYVMNQYAKTISKLDTQLSMTDTLSAVMVMGYLLKGQSDRLDIQKNF
jgi:hypothetical protein